MKYRKTPKFKVATLLVSSVFLITTVAPASYAQIASLPQPGVMLNPSPLFAPPVLKGLKVDLSEPFNFEFIVDSGTDSAIDEQRIRDQSTELIKYFLTSLTMPVKDLWVNLSPYENDHIIEENFGQTSMGKELLTQDYILKQFSASLMYPEHKLGKAFWDRVHQKAYEQYGTTDIPVNTFNKIWIVPGKAVVYENEDSAFIIESDLKVMVEEDYLAIAENKNINTNNEKSEYHEISTAIIKDILIPEVQREVNEGQSFAQLRQIYQSLILAKWYKETLKNSILTQSYADQKIVDGINIEDINAKEMIYNQYLEAFQKGVFDYIKEEYDPKTQASIPKHYFSGGLELDPTIEKRFDASSLNSMAIEGDLLRVRGLFRDSVSPVVLTEEMDAASLRDLIPFARKTTTQTPDNQPQTGKWKKRIRNAALATTVMAGLTAGGLYINGQRLIKSGYLIDGNTTTRRSSSSNTWEMPDKVEKVLDNYISNADSHYKEKLSHLLYGRNGFVALDYALNIVNTLDPQFYLPTGSNPRLETIFFLAHKMHHHHPHSMKLRSDIIESMGGVEAFLASLSDQEKIDEMTQFVQNIDSFFFRFAYFEGEEYPFPEFMEQWSIDEIKIFVKHINSNHIMGRYYSSLEGLARVAYDLGSPIDLNFPEKYGKRLENTDLAPDTFTDLIRSSQVFKNGQIHINSPRTANAIYSLAGNLSNYDPSQELAAQVLQNIVIGKDSIALLSDYLQKVKNYSISGFTETIYQAYIDQYQEIDPTNVDSLEDFKLLLNMLTLAQSIYEYDNTNTEYIDLKEKIAQIDPKTWEPWIKDTSFDFSFGLMILLEIISQNDEIYSDHLLDIFLREAFNFTSLIEAMHDTSTIEKIRVEMNKSSSVLGDKFLLILAGKFLEETPVTVDNVAEQIKIATEWRSSTNVSNRDVRELYGLASYFIAGKVENFIRQNKNLENRPVLIEQLAMLGIFIEEEDTLATKINKLSVNFAAGNFGYLNQKIRGLFSNTQTNIVETLTLPEIQIEESQDFTLAQSFEAFDIVTEGEDLGYLFVADMNNNAGIKLDFDVGLRSGGVSAVSFNSNNNEKTLQMDFPLGFTTGYGKPTDLAIHNGQVKNYFMSLDRSHGLLIVQPNGKATIIDKRNFTTDDLYGSENTAQNQYPGRTIDFRKYEDYLLFLKIAEEQKLSIASNMLLVNGDETSLLNDGNDHRRLLLQFSDNRMGVLDIDDISTAGAVLITRGITLENGATVESAIYADTGYYDYFTIHGVDGTQTVLGHSDKKASSNRVFFYADSTSTTNPVNEEADQSALRRTESDSQPRVGKWKRRIRNAALALSASAGISAGGLYWYGNQLINSGYLADGGSTTQFGSTQITLDNESENLLTDAEFLQSFQNPVTLKIALKPFSVERRHDIIKYLNANYEMINLRLNSNNYGFDDFVLFFTMMMQSMENDSIAQNPYFDAENLTDQEHYRENSYRNFWIKHYGLNYNFLNLSSFVVKSMKMTYYPNGANAYQGLHKDFLIILNANIPYKDKMALAESLRGDNHQFTTGRWPGSAQSLEYAVKIVDELKNNRPQLSDNRAETLLFIAKYINTKDQVIMDMRTKVIEGMGGWGEFYDRFARSDETSLEEIRKLFSGVNTFLNVFFYGEGTKLSIPEFMEAWSDTEIYEFFNGLTPIVRLYPTYTNPTGPSKVTNHFIKNWNTLGLPITPSFPKEIINANNDPDTFIALFKEHLANLDFIRNGIITLESYEDINTLIALNDLMDEVTPDYLLEIIQEVRIPEGKFSALGDFIKLKNFLTKPLFKKIFDQAVAPEYDPINFQSINSEDDFLKFLDTLSFLKQLYDYDQQSYPKYKEFIAKASSANVDWKRWILNTPSEYIYSISILVNLMLDSDPELASELSTEYIQNTFQYNPTIENMRNLESVEVIRLEINKLSPSIGDQFLILLVGDFLNTTPVTQDNINQHVKIAQDWYTAEAVENTDVREFYRLASYFMGNRIASFLENNRDIDNFASIVDELAKMDIAVEADADGIKVKFDKLAVNFAMGNFSYIWNKVTGILKSDDVSTTTPDEDFSVDLTTASEFNLPDSFGSFNLVKEGEELGYLFTADPSQGAGLSLRFDVGFVNGGVSAETFSASMDDQTLHLDLPLGFTTGYGKPTDLAIENGVVKNYLMSMDRSHGLLLVYHTGQSKIIDKRNILTNDLYAEGYAERNQYPGRILDLRKYEDYIQFLRIAENQSLSVASNMLLINDDEFYLLNDGADSRRFILEFSDGQMGVLNMEEASTAEAVIVTKGITLDTGATVTKAIYSDTGYYDYFGVHDVNGTSTVLGHSDNPASSNRVYIYQDNTFTTNPVNEEADQSTLRPKMDEVQSNRNSNEEVGGINFNPDLLELEREGEGITPQNTNLPMPEDFQIKRLYPIIINIEPITLPLLISELNENNIPSENSDNPDNQEKVMLYNRISWFVVKDPKHILHA